MDQNRKKYEPPQVEVYPFDDQDLVLTASGITDLANYAANALNDLFGGTNTTIEN